MMKKIQRILAGALVLAMGVTMVTGCGSSKNDNNSNNDKKSTIDVQISVLLIMVCLQ